jgi:tRNA pseudouridine55 synthase
MVVPIHKPAGITSHDVVYRVRKITGIKKVGHAGTLDPFATGVLVILIGRESTKRSDELMAGAKEYVAKLKLGSVSDTYDIDGDIDAISDRVPTKEELEAAVSKYQGEIEQTPPKFSAKKINGKKLYEYARKGQDIEIPSVKVTIDEIELEDYRYPYAVIRVKCQKGVYIRSIGHDIGQDLGVGAYLESLLRTQVGEHTIENALTLEEFEDYYHSIQQS